MDNPRPPTLIQPQRVAEVESATSTSLTKLLPEDLREPPPRRFAACRHARPEIHSWLVAALLLPLVVLGTLWGSAHSDTLALAGLFGTLALFFMFVNATINLILAVRLARSGVPVPATIVEGTARVRASKLRVWHVRTERVTVSILATDPTPPSMVALVLGKHIGLYHPGPTGRGIHTSRVT